MPSGGSRLSNVAVGDLRVTAPRGTQRTEEDFPFELTLQPFAGLLVVGARGERS
jgi:hypothetical protein